MSDYDLLMHGARNDFMTFARLAFAVVRPGVPFAGNWHLYAIAAVLREAQVSQEVRQIITMPPRSLKSFLISEAFTAYVLGRNPGARVISVSYGEQLSAQMSRNTARIIKSPFYQRAFPATRLASETKLELTTTQGGSRFATSTGGAITGFGGDWVIVDDPMNAIDAASESAREGVKTYFDRALSSRVNDETAARFIVVMQRLHQNDLAGHLLERGGWDELRLQAKATETVEIDIGDRDLHVFKEGDLLHAERLPQAVLDRKRREDSVSFEAQYQQNPLPADGNMVQRHWLRYYTGQTSGDDAQIVLSLDTATKAGTKHDYSACTVWAYRQKNHSLLDVWRAKVEYPELKAKVVDLYQRHRATTLLIEDQGNGAALIQDLRSIGIPAVGRPALRDKVWRLNSATSFIESEQMFLPQAAPWLAEFLRELLGFPNARHDDQVDSLSQYFAWVRERGTGSFTVHSLFDEADPTPETLLHILAALPRY